MKDSKIEWTDHTFNPWWGCTEVSPGCAHCYARTFSKRTGNAVWGDASPRRFFGDPHWAEPLNWNAEAQKTGVQQRVFCASMADVFEDRADLDAPRQRLMELIDSTPWLHWLLLTKRPQNVIPLMKRITNGTFGEVWNFRDHMPNVWLGTTVEDQARADERIPELIGVPAKVHFLSCEPLLGEVDLMDYLDPIDGGYVGHSFLDWIICGGESGGGARPMKGEWAISLRDQCQESGVPFLFKQWGDFDADGKRVGKKKAGRVLDGRTWNELPQREAAFTL